MFNFFKANSTNKNKKFDGKTLKKNDISILILDERWNALFNNWEKTEEVLIYEKNLRELLKEEARLINEINEVNLQKKNSMDKILKLTTLVFEKKDEESRNEMEKCQKEINKINDRLLEIEKEIDSIPQKIKETNLELLEVTVNTVYFKMRQNQNRYKELEKLVEETKKKLEEYIDEKGRLGEDYTDTYSYFHNLLGGEELEKLDKEFFDS